MVELGAGPDRGSDSKPDDIEREEEDQERIKDQEQALEGGTQTDSSTSEQEETQTDSEQQDEQVVEERKQTQPQPDDTQDDQQPQPQPDRTGREGPRRPEGTPVVVSEADDVSNAISPEQLQNIDKQFEADIQPGDIQYLDGELAFTPQGRQKVTETIFSRPGTPGTTARGEGIGLEVSQGASGIDERTSQGLSGVLPVGIESGAFDIEPNDIQQRTNFGLSGSIEAVKSSAETDRQVAKGQAQQDIIQELKEDTGVDLGPEDIKFEEVERDGETFIRGELSRQGQKTVAVESAPFQDTPLEPITETGASIDYEFDKFREENRGTFDRYVPQFDSPIPDLSDEFNAATPDAEDIFKGAAAAAPFAIAEPTPIGEIGVAGAFGIAGLTAGAAAAGASIKEGLPEAEAESALPSNEIPASGEFLPSGGLGMPSTTRQGAFGFAGGEVPLPNPDEVDTTSGIPEEGISIDVGSDPDVVSTTELQPGSPVSPTTMGVPIGETGAGLSTRPIGMQKGGLREQAEEETVTIGKEDLPRIPSEGRPLPSGGGLDIGRGKGTRFVGRQFDPNKILRSPALEGFELLDTAQTPEAQLDEDALEGMSERADSATASSVAASQKSRSMSDTNAQVMIDTVGQDAGTQLGDLGAVDTDIDQILDQPLDQTTRTLTDTGQPTQGVPVQPEYEYPPEYGEIERYPPAYPPGFGTPSKSKKPRLPFNMDTETNDSKRRRGKAISDLFKNPGISPSEAIDYEPIESSLFED